MRVNQISPSFSGLIVFKEYGVAINTDHIAEISNETTRNSGPKVGIRRQNSPIKVFEYNFKDVIEAYKNAAMSSCSVVELDNKKCL